jgi:hypothetical protein
VPARTTDALGGPNHWSRTFASSVCGAIAVPDRAGAEFVRRRLWFSSLCSCISITVGEY